MANLNPSKIWRLANTDESYKDWLTKEKELYQSKIDTGKIQGKIAFLPWLNKRWNRKLSASELEATGIGKIFGGISEKVVKKLRTEEETDYMPESETPKKTILGMKRVVFYSIAGAILVASGFGIYMLVKRMKE